MNLTEQINNDIKAAMLAKDQPRLLALRAIKAEILLAKTEKGGNVELTEEAGNKIIQKLVKQRHDSAIIYKQQGREDLYKQEELEASVIEAYLPKQMNIEEISAVIKKIIAETGADSLKDMGKVMGMAAKQLAGKADNKIVADTVKSLLTA